MTLDQPVWQWFPTFSLTVLPTEYCSARSTPDVPPLVHFTSNYGLMSLLKYPLDGPSTPWLGTNDIRHLLCAVLSMYKTMFLHRYGCAIYF